MSEDGTKATARRAAATRASKDSGYRKGIETRRRILDAALDAFGEAGFRAVTTRQIAECASVSLPALQYYFGDKEGLYRACAEAIVERFQQITASPAAEAAAALVADCTGDAARQHLKAVLGALAQFMAGSHEAEHWANFVAGELQAAGPAFEILYERLWRPGAELIAALISKVTGRPARDQTVRLQAQVLISTLLSFQGGRKQVTLRALGWSQIGVQELALVVAVLNAQIDAIAEA